MSSSEFNEPTVDSNLPRLVEHDNVYIPDIRFLTKVALPSEIDLRDRASVVNLLGQLAEEERARNPFYLGMFLFGSISRNLATNDSDIDGIHVFQAQGKDNKRPDGEPWAIKYRLLALISCYRIKAGDSCFTIVMSDPAEKIKRQGIHLDKNSIPLGLLSSEIERIDGIIGYSKREGLPHRRRKENTSVTQKPHRFAYPKNKIFPLWVVNGLLESI